MPSDVDAASTPQTPSSATPSIPERCSITTEDGLILRAEILYPTELSDTDGRSDAPSLSGVQGLSDARGLVVLCHPHPLHGGNMFANAIDHLFHGLAAAGFACIRFNFRGVTGSDGQHEYGQAEPLDVAAACLELRRRLPNLPLSAVGWSFGGEMALAVGPDLVDHYVAIAPPFTTFEPSALEPKPGQGRVDLIVPENDQFKNPDSVRGLVADWPNTTLRVLPGTDHFLNARLSLLLQMVSESLPHI